MRCTSASHFSAWSKRASTLSNCRMVYGKPVSRKRRRAAVSSPSLLAAARRLTKRAAMCTAVRGTDFDSSEDKNTPTAALSRVSNLQEPPLPLSPKNPLHQVGFLVFFFSLCLPFKAQLDRFNVLSDMKLLRCFAYRCAHILFKSQPNVYKVLQQNINLEIRIYLFIQ